MAMGWCVLGRSVVAEIWLRQALVQRRERGVWLERQADVISLADQPLSAPPQIWWRQKFTQILAGFLSVYVKSKISESSL